MAIPTRPACRRSIIAFTDALADPPGLTDQYYREKLYRLPNFLCYQPPEFTPGVAPLPAKATGQITFGCFNNSNKITDEVVAVWAKIMQRVPGSTHGAENVESFRPAGAFGVSARKFEKNGIEPDRVAMLRKLPQQIGSSDDVWRYRSGARPVPL